MSLMVGIYFINIGIGYIIEWYIFSINGVRIEIILLLDWISLFFLSLVMYIRSLVTNYRKSYIRGNKRDLLFIILIILFVFCIVLLIVRPNIIRILLGWDGLGLVSYVLVIYYQNVKSYSAGILTVLSNRIGDVIILLCIGWIFKYRRWNYIFLTEFQLNDIKWLGVIVIIGGITKRAQIPFSSWLPAAMAAPTPVSALVHSSTLVTAGVYLLIRFSPLFLYNELRIFLLFVSGITIFMSGLGANFEFDLKKIIALSTLRQLGLIIRTLSLGLTKICYFHLLRHALFKALLFICAGFIIHNINNIQDIRFIGGLINQIPLVLIFFNRSNLSLCGIPFLSGFYSKDLILERISILNIRILVYLLFFISTGLTIIYSIRLFRFLILSSKNIFSFHSMFDEDKTIIKSIFGLFLGAVLGGSLLMWLIFPLKELIILPFLIKVMTLLLILGGSYSGIIIYLLKNYLIIFHKKIIFWKWLSGSIFFISILSTHLLRSFILNISYNYIKYIDIGLIEKFGGQGLKEIIINLAKINYNYQGINFKRYLFIFIYFYIVLIILWLII